MPAMKRHPTEYPGVVYVEAKRTGRRGTERVYYIRFKRGGRVVEEKAGRQYGDNMTAAKASRIRGAKVEGREPTRKAAREEQAAARKAAADAYTIARLWAEYKAHNPGLKGLRTDENRFKKHLEPPLGEKEPRELLPLDIERLKRSLEASKVKRRGGGTLSPATVRNTLELLRRIVNFGVRKHLCDPMPFKIGSRRAGGGVAMPDVHNERTEDLSPEEMGRLFTALDESPDVQTANFMRVALYTGMRRGELFKLRWEDVDFERGFLAIQDPKGKKPQKIPMPEEVGRILEAHPRPFPKSPYVFPGRGGKQRVDIIKSARVITKAAGLPADFRPLHGLRHAFASMLASSGKVDLFTLQKLLTHKSPTMTQRYAHLRDESLKRASDVAGAIIAEAQAAPAKPARRRKGAAA